MRLSELVSRLSPTTMTEIALVLFLAVFVAVGLRAWRVERAVRQRGRVLQRGWHGVLSQSLSAAHGGVLP